MDHHIFLKRISRYFDNVAQKRQYPIPDSASRHCSAVTLIIIRHSHLEEHTIDSMLPMKSQQRMHIY